MRLPISLQGSEQWGAWKDRRFHVPRRIKKVADQNASLCDPELEAYLRTHFCTKPFDTMETLDQGSVNICCPDWLPTPIGGINDLPGAWASRTADKIRRSIIDGSFKYCSHVNCSFIANRQLMPRDSRAAKRLIEDFEADQSVPPPRELKLSHDRSCNLSCPSCRTKMLVAGKAKQKHLDDQIETSIVPVLQRAKSVYITGSGDPFGSAHFRRLIKRLDRREFPDLRFRLHTNGQLLNERAWRDLDLAGRVESVHVSIDAARAETYAIVRRGGRFERLLENLEYVKRLRETGDIDTLEISMVVQASNVLEMPAFVRLGRSIGADAIGFEMIRDWGVYTPEDFEKVYLGPHNPRSAELIAVLQTPELSDPRVDAGNVAAHLGLQAMPTRPN